MSAILRRFRVRESHRSHNDTSDDPARPPMSRLTTATNVEKKSATSPQLNASRQQPATINVDSDDGQYDESRSATATEVQYFSKVQIASLNSILHQSSCPYINSECARQALMRREQLYEPLAPEGAFRFVLLYPSEDVDQPLICSLFEHAISPGFDYTALSYEWGTPRIHGRVGLRSTEFIRPSGLKMLSKRSIIINGEDTVITSNLFDALVHIRTCSGKKSDNVLWVDALCINQRDVAERGYQVAQMGTIYSQAQQVICWLGRATKDTYSVPYYSSLDIVQRSFWDRVWIMQEFILAPKVILLCGERSFSPAEIQDTSVRFHRFQMLRILRSRYHASGSKLAFRDAVGWSGSASATDPRDRIYGIMGLVDKEDIQDFDLDYMLSPCEVFCRALQILYPGFEARYDHFLGGLKHLNTFRRKVDPYAEERKVCDGSTDCIARACMKTFYAAEWNA